MTTPVTTVEKIIKKLNKGRKGPWVEVPTPYILSTVSIDESGIKRQNRGMVQKIFVNTKTGETKTYVAKLIDIPEAKHLT